MTDGAAPEDGNAAQHLVLHSGFDRELKRRYTRFIRRTA
jgi:hypothetical protein